MAFLDDRAQGARNRQKQALIAEASAAGARVVDVVELGGEASGAGVLGGSLTALVGGRMQIDCVQVLRLDTGGWSHAYAQPYAGLTPLPGEHHGSLVGALPSPAILRADLRYSDYPWDPAAGREAAAWLTAAPAVRAMLGDFAWSWAVGMTKVELDWAVQLRSAGGGYTHVVMQSGRYGGLTTYEVGFRQWLGLCRVLAPCLGQHPTPPQAFVVPARFGELIDAAAGRPPAPAHAHAHESREPGGVEVRVDYLPTIQRALAPHLGKKVWLDAIPPKKLANLRKHVLPAQLSASPILAGVDLTAFGSAKDAIVVTPRALVAKEFDDVLIIELPTIRSVPGGQKPSASHVEVVVDRLGTLRIPVGIDFEPVHALLQAIAAANAGAEGTHAQVSAFIGEGAGQMSAEQAQALAAQVQASMATGAVDSQLNAAAQLLLGGQHQASIDAHLAIAQANPGYTGVCYGQIGAGLFFLGQYGRAIEYYEAAKQHGADPAMMDDNIAEARMSL